MSYSKIMKVISVLLSIVSVISLSVMPVFAVESGGWTGNTLSTGGFSGAGYWDVVYSAPDAPAYGDEVLKGLGKLSSEDACPTSETGHHVGSAFRVRQGEKRSIYVADCRCDSCSAEFSTIVSVDELNAAYNAYVSSLPSSSLDSEGYLIWYPKLSEAHIASGGDAYIVEVDVVGFTVDVVTCDCVLSEHSFVVKGTSKGTTTDGCVDYRNGVGTRWDDTAPIAGYYSLSSGFDVTGYYIDATGNRVDMNQSASVPVGEPTFRAVGSRLYDKSDRFTIPSGVRYSYFTFNCSVPYYRIQPLTGLIDPSSDTTYNINTRPTFISNDYGFYDESDEPQLSQGTQIVNEAGGKFYNPVTGNTLNVSNWTYDYADRKYNGVADDGTQWAVTYGDGDITIVEGDKTYNIYYMLPSGPADNCQHEYTSTVTTAPTCTFPGTETFTCSKCQHSYTQSIPARGHTWQVKQTVTTQYDESGNLLTQGYTIYECSVCHEQYKDSGGTGPPSTPGSDDPSSPTTIGGLIEKLLSGVGSVVGGLIKGVLALLTKAVEALAGIGELFTKLVESVVTIFGSFTNFLSAVFPFLPEEFFTIFSLGMLLLVAAAVLKKFLS